MRIDLFGDQVESIRRFDVESQRSVLKVEDCTLLPLTEYQKSRELLVELGELMREAGIPGRDLPPPGEPFPGWELVAPHGCGRRHGSVFSLLERPVVVWDEPEQVAGAAERFWKRLEQIERSPAYDPGQGFLPLGRAGAPGRRPLPQLALKELEIGWRSTSRSAHCHPALPGLPRQHAGGHRRGAQPGGSRQPGGVLRFFYR